MILRKVSGNIENRLAKLKKELPLVPEKAATKFKSVTPIKTGNARNNTNLSNIEIKADYPYANALNEGRSKQAPNGMTQPTIDYIRTVIRNI